MKQYKLTFLLAVLMSMASIKAFAYDIAVKNADGKTIYYNYIDKYYNYGTELEVTSGPNKYSGDIVIPYSVTYMNMEKIVRSIGDYAFYHCSDLTSVYIPYSVTSIGDRAFDGCWCMTWVNIPDGVTSIGTAAFESCQCLTSVRIPNSVTSIKMRAFRDCSGLKSVTIPNSITSIGYSTFELCSSLTSVTIPNSVTSIGSNAFNYCSGLTSVTIGSRVNSIGSGAFNCDNLATVISKIETPFAINGKSSSDPVFSNNTFMNADLFVPVGTIDKYKATQGWKDFVWITEGIPSGVEGVKTDDDKTEVSRYTLDGMILSEPRKGINIIKMSDGTSKKVIIK